MTKEFVNGPIFTDEVGTMALDEIPGVAAYSGEGGSWIEHPDYVRYSQFSDGDISTISDTKEITLNTKQFNITQEENSQYIPFEMPRRYDGFDLALDALLSIHFDTSTGIHGADKPINVTYNDDKIRFGWLVSPDATVDPGALKFEIHAYGILVGSDGVRKGYTWKTQSNDKLNVLQSVCDCEDIINKIDDTWLQELITDISESMAEKIATMDIGDQVASAQAAAERAEAALSNLDATVGKYLVGYATEKYVDDAIADADISEKLNDYAKTSYVDKQVDDVGGRVTAI